eukprot:m.135327 g.135327  ORF g.135327 m.135327 type:complete len:324 (+) comp29788_c1_seq1:205-1176(+)
MSEFELNQPPTDGISSLSFSPAPANFLMVTSWDQTVRLYDVVSNSLRTKFEVGTPVLSGCISSPIQGFSGGLDGTVRSHDLNSGTQSTVGSHTEAVRCLDYSQTKGAVLSGSWDKTVKMWDPRESKGEPTQTATLPDKVYTMSTEGDKLVVGTAGRHVWIYDLRRLDVPEQRRESSLKFQTRHLKMNNAGDGYVLSSIDGRVAVEWIDPSPDGQSQKYAFKCHRVKQNGQDVIYPVNTLAFHPAHGTFASGGCDGMVNVWDGAKRKRLCQFHRYPTSVSALAFSHDGYYLAVAASYTYEEGEKDHPGDAIYIRETTEEETKSK